jgi:hypothetical protein
MNERIKELMKQSMVEYQFDLRFSPEKFAELIVRECATLCISEGRAHDQWFGSHCAVTVKEHFGVK